jgi:chromosome segregation ATPase
MLEDLQTQVIEEGKAEATTYDKFACFCKDMSDDKSDAITTGQTNVEDLTALMNEKTAYRAELDTQIEELNNAITTMETEIKDAKAHRAAERAEYLKNKGDVKKGIGELDAAMKVLKMGQEMEKGGHMLLVQKTVRKAVLMADALNLTPKMSAERRDAIAALLQGDPGHEVNYDDHSGGIIDTVEGLENDFVEEKGDMKADEQTAQQEHDKLVLSKELQIGTAQKNLESTEETRATTTKEIASTQQDLTGTLAQLHDDQAYLRDLTAKCEDKSKEWDQRSSMRQDELSAITEALAIIKGTVTAKTTEKTVRLVEQQAVVKPHVVVDEDSEEDDDEDEDVSFLQVESPRAKLSALAMDMQKTSGFLAATTPRDRLVALLTSKGKSLKSTVLATLATKVAADPFAKIKKLVQELIERLLQEAADEANHKGWCDKELTNAKQQRGYKANAVKKLNAQLESAEAKRDKLSEEIATLTTELAELNDSLSSTTAQRAAESAENAATVSEAEEGQAAVEQAFDVLDHFYKKAAKAEVELVQVRAASKGVDDDLPDTGFGGANKGSQGAATGILGMLEVIKSDFVRTIKETEKAEKEAESEFIEFERTTKVSIRTKETTKSNNEAEHSATVNEISDAMTDLREEQSLMDKALQELEELRPACIDTGMSYEERVARREQEIEALNEALCILDAEGPVQTEPSC